MNPLRKVALGGAMAAATIAGGALGATFLGTANAASGTSSTTTPAATAATAPGSDKTRPSFPAHGTPEHEALEKPVTGDAATKAQDAAVKAAGGGTAGDVTTDASGTGYEVSVTQTDGTKTEYHLDSTFTVMQDGRGGHHSPRANDNDADDTPIAAAPAN